MDLGTFTLSIVVICRDNADELRTTLMSATEQGKNTPLQTIVIDGSVLGDDCAVVAQSSGIVTDLVSEPDQGLYDAMNQGIAFVRARTVLFMNSGDRFAPGFDLAAFIERNKGDLGKTVVAGRTIFRLGSRRFLCTALPPVHQSMFFPKDAIDQLGVYRTDLRVAADVDFIDRMVSGRGMRRVEEFVSEFQLGGLSTAPRNFNHVLVLLNDAKAVGRVKSLKGQLKLLLTQAVKMGAVRLLGFERTFLIVAKTKSSWCELEPSSQSQVQAAK